MQENKIPSKLNESSPSVWLVASVVAIVFSYLAYNYTLTIIMVTVLAIMIELLKNPSYFNEDKTINQSLMGKTAWKEFVRYLKPLTIGYIVGWVLSIIVEKFF